MTKEQHDLIKRAFDLENRVFHGGRSIIWSTFCDTHTGSVMKELRKSGEMETNCFSYHLTKKGEDSYNSYE